MKKVINRILLVIGIIFIALILISNILFDVRLSNDLSEYANIELIQITIWINYRNASPGWDSQSVYEIAKDMYEGKALETPNFNYAEKYPHQIPLAFMESLVMKVQRSQSFRIFQYINAKVKPIKMIEGK